VPRDNVRRDLLFFIPIFLALMLLGLGHLSAVTRHSLAVGLLAIYGIYGFVMLRLTRAPEVELEHGLYLESLLRGSPSNPRSTLTFLQVAAGTLAILFGAREFVDQIVLFSHHAGLNPGVLSLILSPLATELPEKYNSVVWIRQRKDHLAVANITGAMVFQSCIPVALGLALTPWHLSDAELLGAAIALVSAGLLFVNVRDGKLGTPSLMLGGIAYAAFIAGLGFLGLF
jgi:cation:H+ antiporter